MDEAKGTDEEALPFSYTDWKAGSRLTTAASHIIVLTAGRQPRDGSRRTARRQSPDGNRRTAMNEVTGHFQMQNSVSSASDLIDTTGLECKKYKEEHGMQHSFPSMEGIAQSLEALVSQDVHKAHDLVEILGEESIPFLQIMERIRVDIGMPLPSLEVIDAKIKRFAKKMNDVQNLKMFVPTH